MNFHANSISEQLLFESLDDSNQVVRPSRVITPIRPVWTKNKSKLIELYLKLFLMITKNGVYIDGFAGPQRYDHLDMWCASRILRLQPYWMTHFYLFEKNPHSVKHLYSLVEEVTKIHEEKRKIKTKIFGGDVNNELPAFLKTNPIREKSACFCLLDQRTFECDWSTVKQVAQYKKNGNKIEILYFLANSWFDRSIAAIRDFDILQKWWGRSDYMTLRGIKGVIRANKFVERFKEELGYKYVDPWEIYESENSRRVMYYLIHATDHEAAPTLMSRAYRHAVDPIKCPTQLDFWGGHGC